MSVNFAAVREGQASYADALRDTTVPMLRDAVGDVFDAVDATLDGLTDHDVVFQPVDPAANDTFAAPGTDAGQAWTLGHVVVHLTAGLEESAVLGATLARGVTVAGRSRYETPWKSVTTAAHVRQRMAESRRMCTAFLDAWPDAPHLELTDEPIPRFGPMTAIGRTALGVFHAESHLEQLREIRKQASA